MMRRLGPLLIAVVLALLAGCDGGNDEAATEPPQTTTTSETGKAALERAARSALADNRRLSVYVLWNNRIPAWAERSTRGPALASLRTAAQNRKTRGIRVRMLGNQREVRSLRLDPSYLRATAVVLDRQRVQPSRRNGKPLGRATVLRERARYELRRVGGGNQFVVWTNSTLGTYVVFEGDTDYARRCFKEYAMLPDRTGKYAALYRPIHMIGLELGISVASAALRNEPTGAPTGFRSDVVATAKRDLKAGEMLDGEGGFCVWGKQTRADLSLRHELLPLGLAHNVKLKRDIAEGQPLRWSDVNYDPNDSAVKVRREMEAAFGRRNVGAEPVF
jgi:hypothetical protein